jgi:hypothetical protein
MRNKKKITQAVVAMGYRKGNDTTFLKPFGLSILEGRFITEKDKDIFRITLLVPGRLNVLYWNHEDIDYLHPEEQWTNVDESIDGEELFELYCKMIASAEDSIGMEHGVNLYKEDKPMAFITPYDVYHWFE